MTKIQLVNLPTKEIYLLRELTSVLFDLLEAVSTGRVIQIDDRINTEYLRLCNRIGELAGDNFERPFSSLYLAGEDIDVEWSMGSKQRLLDFLGKVEYEFEKKGRKSFYDELSSEEKDLLDTRFLIEDLKQNETTQDDEVTFYHEGVNTINSDDKVNIPQSLPYISDDGFHITLADGVNHVIPFDTKKTRNKTLEVFKVIFSLWKQNASSGKTILTKDEILNTLRKKGINDIDTESIRADLSRIRKKFENSVCSKTVILGDFSPYHKGYPFEIKQPTP